LGEKPSGILAVNLSGLNEPQREAVTHRGSPLLVLAGAGSGKTRVIIHRIAHLLYTRDAKADQILAVTFTNRAANEMKQRVERLVGEKVAQKLSVSTFHSFCATLLRQEIKPLGYSKRFTIYDSSDQRALLSRCLGEFSTGGERLDIGAFQYRISRAKNKGLTPDTFEPERHDKYDGRIPDVWEAYQKALLARDALDFDDLLFLVHRLFQENPGVLDKMREKHRHILVDEYQDTNSIQFQIARELALEHRNLCVVGDDDQSIYGWRGAEISNILDFDSHFPDARVITLDRNYRSTETIITASSAVISRNVKRREKNLWSREGRGRPVDVVSAQDELDEVDCILRRMKEMRVHFNLNWSDFGILYRSNIQSRPFEINFRQNRVPYVVVGGMEFFDRKEVKDVAAYLRVMANPKDEVSLRRIVNVPRRGIGDTTLQRLNETAAARKKSLLQVMRSSDALNLPDSARKGIREFLSLLDRSSQTVRKDGLSRGVLHLIRESGYVEEVERNAPSVAAFENQKQVVLEVANAADAYQRSEKRPSLSGFLQHASLANDYQQDKSANRFGGDAVRLMTLHSAKGLEFPVVFLVGIEEGLLPHSRAMVFDSDVVEERRLFYVGMTRARKHLILTTASLRTIRGRPKPTTDSRFLEEIPDELVRFQEAGQRVLDGGQLETSGSE
jgi:ATP-dependent DNA helicase UvrD/PcrA